MSLIPKSLNQPGRQQSIHQLDHSRLDPANPDSVDPANTDPANEAEEAEKAHRKPSKPISISPDLLPQKNNQAE